MEKNRARKKGLTVNISPEAYAELERRTELAGETSGADVPIARMASGMLHMALGFRRDGMARIVSAPPAVHPAEPVTAADVAPTTARAGVAVGGGEPVAPLVPAKRSHAKKPTAAPTAKGKTTAPKPTAKRSKKA